MCKWFLGSIRICLPKRHTLYRSFLLNHESRQDGKCTVATVSGDDAILDDVEDGRGVVESGGVLVDPAVSRQVLVVDVHRHTSRRDHTVVQTGLGRRHAPVLLAVERVCVGAVPPAHRTHCIIVTIIVSSPSSYLPLLSMLSYATCTHAYYEIVHYCGNIRT